MSSTETVISPGRTGLKSEGLDLRFRVVDWMACAPGREEKADWLAWARGEALPVAERRERPTLPAPLRRRVSAIGQMAFRAVHGLPQQPRARFIFCSRHGEFRRTRALLESVARREPSSPAEFSLSVHNALAGLLSIAWKNDAGHTALAAGVDSFGFGLLEAAACLASGHDDAILLVYFDEPLPDEYAVFRDGEETSLALALLLKPACGNGADLILSLEPKQPGGSARPATAQAIAFLLFLLSGESERLSPGGAARWRWRRAAA